jgi:DNA-binding NarL/FixJ family response regulator
VVPATKGTRYTEVSSVGRDAVEGVTPSARAAAAADHDMLPTAPREGQVVRVLTVDDHESFRRAVHAVTEATDGFEEVGTACTGEAAISAATQLAPDLVLMDVHLPGIDGCDASRAIVDRLPDTIVVLTSSTEDGLQGRSPASCSAAAFVRKDELRPRVLNELWEANRRDR